MVSKKLKFQYLGTWLFLLKRLDFPVPKDLRSISDAAEISRVALHTVLLDQLLAVFPLFLPYKLYVRGCISS